MEAGTTSSGSRSNTLGSTTTSLSSSTTSPDPMSSTTTSTSQTSQSTTSRSSSTQSTKSTSSTTSSLLQPSTSPTTSATTSPSNIQGNPGSQTATAAQGALSWETLKLPVLIGGSVLVLVTLVITIIAIRNTSTASKRKRLREAGDGGGIGGVLGRVRSGRKRRGSEGGKGDSTGGREEMAYSSIPNPRRRSLLQSISGGVGGGNGSNGRNSPSLRPGTGGSGVTDEEYGYSRGGDYYSRGRQGSATALLVPGRDSPAMSASGSPVPSMSRRPSNDPYNQWNNNTMGANGYPSGTGATGYYYGGDMQMQMQQQQQQQQQYNQYWNHQTFAQDQQMLMQQQYRQTQTRSSSSGSASSGYERERSLYGGPSYNTNANRYTTSSNGSATAASVVGYYSQNQTQPRGGGSSVGNNYSMSRNQGYANNDTNDYPRRGSDASNNNNTVSRNGNGYSRPPPQPPVPPTIQKTPFTSVPATTRPASPPSVVAVSNSSAGTTSRSRTSNGKSNASSTNGTGGKSKPGPVAKVTPKVSKPLPQVQSQSIPTTTSSTRQEYSQIPIPPIPETPVRQPRGGNYNGNGGNGGGELYSSNGYNMVNRVGPNGKKLTLAEIARMKHMSLMTDGGKSVAMSLNDE
ncbi:hypothetical protein HDU76_012225 [Blyttiomyces sp. JEL0837]|nr:hypothetical protein HDU76_012225 [Blyttiomyces sp. JEL0837]